MPDPAAGWYRDPTGRRTHRYWTGSEWSDHVADHGVADVDPISDEDRLIPPAPEDHEPSAPPPPMVTVTQTSASGSIVGWVIALLFIVVLVVVLVNLVGPGDDTTVTTVPAEVTTVPAEVTTVPSDTTTTTSG